MIKLRRRIRRLHAFRRDLMAIGVAVLLSAGLVFGQSGDDVSPTRPADAKISVSAVYPEPDRSIRFDHTRHEDVPCARCHAQASTSRRSADSLSPTMQACAGCHQETEPKLQKCGGCHTGHPVEASEKIDGPESWRAVRPAPMKLPRPRPNLRFDHARHVRLALAGSAPGEAAAGCAGCHRPDGAKMSMPSMATCTSCHDGTSAPSDCTTCHPTGENGRLQTRFAQGQKETRWLKPDDHTVEWKKRHAVAAKANSAECSSCHTEQDCADCHVEQVARPFSVHPPNFLTIHAVDARANLGNCTDCHDVESFCTSCHTRAKALPTGENAAPPKLDYHPPGWLDANRANNHGVMARRNITECATCHREDDCVACHAGVNPHPPEFRVNCRRLFDANPRPCAKCHGDLRAIQSRCL